MFVINQMGLSPPLHGPDKQTAACIANIIICHNGSFLLVIRSHRIPNPCLREQIAPNTKPLKNTQSFPTITKQSRNHKPIRDTITRRHHNPSLCPTPRLLRAEFATARVRAAGARLARLFYSMFFKKRLMEIFLGRDIVLFR